MVDNVNVEICKLRAEAIIPSQNKEYDAGYDLYACDYVKISPLERKLVSTGISIAIPPGYYGQIAPRSGLALKQGIQVMAGVIDSSYRAEIGVILYNSSCNLMEMLRGGVHYQMFGSSHSYDIKPGDRIAQLIIKPCASVKFLQVSELNKTDRGESGFGSSGR